MEKKSVFDEVNKDINKNKPTVETNKNITNNQIESSDNYNPLQGETIKRDYAQQIGANDDIPVIDRVPETNYVAEPQPEKKENDAEKNIANKDKEGKKEESQYNQPPANENMGELPNKDQKKAAGMLTNAVLKAYGEAWKAIGGTQKLSDQKVIDMVVKGELSYDVLVPINGEGEVTLGEFISTYNNTIDVSTIVTEEFIEEVKESMINEFMRMGWGITDRQNIAQAFIRDSLTKSVALFQLKGTMKSILGILKENYKQQKEEVQQKYGTEYVEPNQPYTKQERGYSNQNNESENKNRPSASTPPTPPPPPNVKKEPAPPPPPPPPNVIKKESVKKEDVVESNGANIKSEDIPANSDLVEKFSISETPLMKEKGVIVETVPVADNFDEIAKEHDRLANEAYLQNKAQQSEDTNLEE